MRMKILEKSPPSALTFLRNLFSLLFNVTISSSSSFSLFADVSSLYAIDLINMLTDVGALVSGVFVTYYFCARLCINDACFLSCFPPLIFVPPPSVLLPYALDELSSILALD